MHDRAKPDPARATGHVLLLPGWGTSLVRLEPLAGDLRDAELDVRLAQYEPEGSIEALGDRLAASLSPRLRDGRPLHLVGHSLGGLVCAAAALGPLVDDLTSVTTINAPWRGTWLGYTGESRLAASLRWGGEPLEQLRDRLTAHLARRDGPSWHLVGTVGDLGVSFVSATRAARGSPRRHDRLRTSLVWTTGHSVSLLKEPLRETVVEGVLGATPRTHDTR